MRGLLICALFFSILITTFHFGFFSWAGFAVLLGLLGILFFLFFFPYSFLEEKKNLSSSLPCCFILVYSLFLFGSTGIYQTEFFSSSLLSFLPALLFPLVLTYGLLSSSLSQNGKKNRFRFLLIAALVFRLLIIIASPKPIIDVFTILKEAPLALFSGTNPYNTVFSQVYKGVETNYYAYWPASFILEAPFVFLFGDPRLLLVMADIGSAILLFLLGRKSEQTEVLSLLYLFRPNALFIIEQSWLTPLVFFLTLLSFYFVEHKKEFLAGITLGVLTGVQPLYSIVALFLFPRFKNLKKGIASYILTISSLVAPFFLWNPAQFIEKTVFVYFKPLSSIPTIPVHLSLNLNTAFFTLTGRDIPFIFSFILLLTLTVLIFSRLFSLYKFRESMFGTHLTLALCLFFFSFYFLFRQSFINYYYLATGFLLLWFVRLLHTDSGNQSRS